jgi:hypothetical protein
VHEYGLVQPGRIGTGWFFIKRGPLIPFPTQQQQEEETTPLHFGKETHPTGSEEEQTIVKTRRPSSKKTPLAVVYLIFVLCSLFFVRSFSKFEFFARRF